MVFETWYPRHNLSPMLGDWKDYNEVSALDIGGFCLRPCAAKKEAVCQPHPLYPQRGAQGHRCGLTDTICNNSPVSGGWSTYVFTADYTEALALKEEMCYWIQFI